MNTISVSKRLFFFLRMYSLRTLNCGGAVASLHLLLDQTLRWVKAGAVGLIHLEHGWGLYHLLLTYFFVTAFHVHNTMLLGDTVALSVLSVIIYDIYLVLHDYFGSVHIQTLVRLVIAPVRKIILWARSWSLRIIMIYRWRPIWWLLPLIK